MVTVELACASLVAAAVASGAIMVAGGAFRLVECQLTANEVARQAARDDGAAVARARQQAPEGARVTIREEAGATVVLVEVEAHVGPARVPLSATARVLAEG